MKKYFYLCYVNTHKIIATFVELKGIKSDISRYGTPYTLAEAVFTFSLKGKKTFLHMTAFDDIAKSLKYFDKNSLVEIDFTVSTKYVLSKPMTGCIIENIKKAKQDEHST